jgi:hypothetical protein
MVLTVTSAFQLFKLEILLSSRVMTVTVDLVTKRFMRGRQADTCMAASRGDLTIWSKGCQVRCVTTPQDANRDSP